MVKIEDEYTNLKDKHSLPDFEVMDKEFEISTLEDERFLLRHMRIKIDDKITDMTKIFEGLLHPENSFAAFKEANSFSDEERENMLDVYQRIMYFHRSATELSIDDSDEKNVQFINAIMKEWEEMKKQTLSFVSRLKESWTGEITKKEVVGYLG